MLTVVADWTIDLFSRPVTSKLFEGPRQPKTQNELAQRIYPHTSYL